MQQQVTLQVNTKTMFKVMVGMMLAVPAAILLTLAVLIPSIAKADTNQTANSNPSFNIPAGYALVPAGSGGTCPSGTGTGGAGVVTPVVFSSVLPTSYTTTTTQTHNETNNDYEYEDSFNTTTTKNSNNNNGSNNTTGSNNPTSTVVTTTTNTDNSNNSTNNSNNTNNSTNNSNNNNTDNTDGVIVRIVDSFQITPILP